MNWTRICQECGTENERTLPPPLGNAKKMMVWDNIPCKKCKSTSLDYGYDRDEVVVVDEEDDEA